MSKFENSGLYLSREEYYGRYKYGEPKSIFLAGLDEKDNIFMICKNCGNCWGIHGLNDTCPSKTYPLPELEIYNEVENTLILTKNIDFDNKKERLVYNIAHKEFTKLTNFLNEDIGIILQSKNIENIYNKYVALHSLYEIPEGINIDNIKTILIKQEIYVKK